MKLSVLVICIFAFVFLSLSCQAAKTKLKKNETNYHSLNIEGWSVNIEKKLVIQNDRRVFTALRLLAQELRDIKEFIPRQNLRQLFTVPIWISEDSGGHGEFYFSERYVYRNGKNPEMLDAIEFHNINYLISGLKRNSMVVVHELAHAYHKMNYKKIDKKIMRAYRNARDKKLYKNVETIYNKKKDAYALKNAFEYFAELTETYYGKNDYFPYTEKQLKKYDPMGYDMIKSIW